MMSATSEGANQSLANKKRINWLNSIFLIGSPVVAPIAGYWHATTYGIGWAEILIFFIWYWACGLSITVGYHRLFSHKSHEASSALVFLYAIFGAAAFQNSIVEWASDHRNHHKYTDLQKDPYNAKKGFLWSHILWILVDNTSEQDFTNVKDLSSVPIIAWQHRHIFKIGIFVGMIIPGLIGFAFGGIGGGIGGFIWGGFLRTVFVHHGTFLINSASHIWGRQPYLQTNTSRDSFWLAFFTFGEGYHNFHHAFQADYRNGHRWFHFDPSKWWISTFSLFKLNKKLKRAPQGSIAVAKLDGRFERMKSQVIRNNSSADISDFELKMAECRKNLRRKMLELSKKNEEYKKSIAAKKAELGRQITEIKGTLADIRVEISKIFSEMKVTSKITLG
jgi:stearoyl-CoA desaturase (delta-9 desaturase)